MLASEEKCEIIYGFLCIIKIRFRFEVAVLNTDEAHLFSLSFLIVFN